MKTLTIITVLLISLITLPTKVQSQNWDNPLHGSDFKGDGKNTSLEIPLIVVLWDNVNFTGVKKAIIRNEPNLGAGVHCQSGVDFNDRTSALGIHPGPDYDNWKAAHGGKEPTVSLFADANYKGRKIVVKTGIYSDLRKFNFNDVISSVRFNDPDDNSAPLAPNGGAAQISPIPVALRLHTAGKNMYCDEDENAIWMVEQTSNILEYGGSFNDQISWVEIFKGPNWSGSDHVTFFENSQSDGGGRYIDYTSPSDADLINDRISLGSTATISNNGSYSGDSKSENVNFNDILSSVLINSNYHNPPTTTTYTHPQISFNATPVDGSGSNARINIGQTATLHWNITDCPKCNMSIKGADYDTKAIVLAAKINQTTGSMVVKPPSNTNNWVEYTLTATGDIVGSSTKSCTVSVYWPPSSPKGQCAMTYYFKCTNPSSYAAACFTMEVCDTDPSKAETQVKNILQLDGYSGYSIMKIDQSQVASACQ